MNLGPGRESAAPIDPAPAAVPCPRSGPALPSLLRRIPGRAAAWGPGWQALLLGSLLALSLLAALLPMAAEPGRSAGPALEGLAWGEVEVERTDPVLQALLPAAPELERPVRETGPGNMVSLGTSPSDLPDPSPAPAPGLLPTALPAHVLCAAACPHAHQAPQQPPLRPPTA